MITTHVELPAVHPFTGADVATMFHERVARRPDHPALVWEPGPPGIARTWTYAELSADVEVVAAGLRARGVRRGDAVMLLLDNSPAFLTCWLACASLGAVAVDTNVHYSSDELEHAISLSQPVGIVTDAARRALLDDLVADRWVVLIDESTGACPDLHGAAADVPAREPDAAAPLCIQFTSGTTSRPKAVVYTHANALWAGKVGAMHGDVRDDDVFLVYMPLFHTAALMWHVMPTLWVGGTVVLMPRYSASRFWEVSVRNGCTQTMLLGISKTTLDRQPVPPHTYRIWQFALAFGSVERRYGVRVLGCWGMTEVVTSVVVGDLARVCETGAIGWPAAEYAVRIVGEDGVDVAPGDAGELRVRGVQGLSLFAEYLDDPAATAEAFDADGYFRTGDSVRQLPSGAIEYLSRIKDMLKVGGENVAAAEIERVCLSVPGVTAAAVVGRRDRVLDEVPVAFVVAPGAEETAIGDAVIRACEAALARFKVPRSVHVVEALPERLLGKVAKADLRRLADELAGG